MQVRPTGFWSLGLRAAMIISLEVLQFQMSSRLQVQHCILSQCLNWTIKIVRVKGDRAEIL